MSMNNFASRGVKLLFLERFKFDGGRRSDLLNFGQSGPVGVNLRQRLRGEIVGDIVRRGNVGSQLIRRSSGYRR